MLAPIFAVIVNKNCDFTLITFTPFEKLACTCMYVHIYGNILYAPLVFPVPLLPQNPQTVTGTIGGDFAASHKKLTKIYLWVGSSGVRSLAKGPFARTFDLISSRSVRRPGFVGSTSCKYVPSFLQQSTACSDRGLLTVNTTMQKRDTCKGVRPASRGDLNHKLL